MTTRSIIAPLMGIGLLTLIICAGIYRTSAQVTEITVTKEERTVLGTGENLHSKYLVYTNDEVFENTDSWLFLKFNSSDLQGKMEPHRAYRVKVAGWRVPFLSWHRNIVEVQPIGR